MIWLALAIQAGSVIYVLRDCRRSLAMRRAAMAALAQARSLRAQAFEARDEALRVAFDLNAQHAALMLTATRLRHEARS